MNKHYKDLKVSSELPVSTSDIKIFIISDS